MVNLTERLVSKWGFPKLKIVDRAILGAIILEHLEKDSEMRYMEGELNSPLASKFNLEYSRDMGEGQSVDVEGLYRLVLANYVEGRTEFDLAMIACISNFYYLNYMMGKILKERVYRRIGSVHEELYTVLTEEDVKFILSLPHSRKGAWLR